MEHFMATKNDGKDDYFFKRNEMYFLSSPPHIFYIFIFKTTLSPDMCWAFTRSLIIILFEVSLDIIHCITQIEKKRKKICNLIFSETPRRKTNNKNPKHKNKSWMRLANLSDVKWKKKIKNSKSAPCWLSCWAFENDIPLSGYLTMKQFVSRILLKTLQPKAN